MLNKDNPKTVSILVCFAGKNRRVEINPKKCVTNPNHDFSYSAQYKADDGKLYMVKVVSIPDTKGAKKAELNYEVLDELDTDEGPISYLLIELLTERHHQIRCQLAHAGLGIWGDIKYNTKFKDKSSKSSKAKGRTKAGKGSGIGLFSTMLEFIHPVTGEEISLHREPEGEAFDIIDQMDW